ncbi:MAG: HAMP domain-containing protein, partial [Calditrichia bacterium]|nr:HAMP domain-containing protein [Calditrichia bacterium]
KKWVDKPVTDLVDATKLVASGNFIYKIKNVSKDELGDLQKSFNLMTKKLAEARKQLFQSDKMASMGRLAAGVAHEINNPLTGILSYSSFLLKRAERNSELKNDLKVIVSETMRCRDIVKSLLDFARQSVPKKNKSDINQIIERSLTVVENQLNIKKINVMKNFASNLPEIIVDINQIQQVFVNLIVNAADATGEYGGTITLSTSLISLSPFGITQIKNATCPKNHNLMDNDFKINGMPSIKMKAITDGNEGYINFDPVYGKHKNHYGLPFSKKKLVELYCPECNTPMVDKTLFCPKCNSPIYKIFTTDQGNIEGCTKLGCHWQRWKEIDSQGERQYIEIDVSDTGCGIKKENIDRIYEPFYSTKGQKGTGLGLSVIWGIIDNHKGRITVKSEEGKGTNFKIIIPGSVN